MAEIQLYAPMAGTQLSSSIIKMQLHGQTSTSQHHGRTPTSQHHGQIPTSTVCLNGRQPNCLPTWPKVNSQMTVFQNLQILRIIDSGQDVILTTDLFPIWDLLWQLWLSYPLRVSVNYTQCYAPELRAE